jgi:hypothetical protein
MLTLQWSREASEGDLSHRFSFTFAEPLSAPVLAPICMRLLAHLTLDQLPDAALTEVLTSLNSAWMFYQPVRAEFQETARIRKGKGKVVRRYNRPTYAIEE